MRQTFSKLPYRCSIVLLALGILLTCLWLRRLFSGGDQGWANLGSLILIAPVAAAALLNAILGLILHTIDQNQRHFKTLLFSGITLVLLAIQILLITQIPSVQIMAAGANGEAGTWENDPKNWERAFRTNASPAVTVVNSKYWRSNHFTYEYMWFFEIRATAAWRDEFLQSRGLKLEPPAKSRSFRDKHTSKMTPDWFAPDPVELYDVWNGTHGTLWINKTNGHIHFYGVLL
ncbi:MAG TPA: hypothetical protein VGH19_04325 [Verrucomicrobiae bacterium]